MRHAITKLYEQHDTIITKLKELHKTLYYHHIISRNLNTQNPCYMRVTQRTFFVSRNREGGTEQPKPRERDFNLGMGFR